MVVFKNVTKEDAAKLLKKGFVMGTPKTMHEALRLSKKNVALILYNSGKLLLQGKQVAKDNIADEIRRLKIGEEEQKISFRKETGWMIGSDETLKGDTFGGLVVAAVKANDENREKLKELGVADSKKLADSEIIVMADKIKKLVQCEILNLFPEEYNREDGVTALLNKLHHKTASYLKPGKHVVDKYPGCTVGDIITEKAESKYIEVAAASVLARAAGLQQLKTLSIQAGFEIPKGSTHVKEALQKLVESKLEPKKFVKMHFRNVREFLSH